MEDFERRLTEIESAIDQPATRFRTAYEHKNALYKQLQLLDEVDSELAPFNGNAADATKQRAGRVRDSVDSKLRSVSPSKKAHQQQQQQQPSQRTTHHHNRHDDDDIAGDIASAIPGSEEWLRQLQAEDEVDQEHERRAQKQRGKHRGRPVGKKSAHGGGKYAGEIDSQRDQKNALKELGPTTERLTNLVHPMSQQNLDKLTSPGTAASSDSKSNTPRGSKKQQQLQREELFHETHRDCHFRVLTNALLVRPAVVTNVENQPLVEIRFEAQKRVSVPPHFLDASNNNNNKSSSSNPAATAMAVQLGFITKKKDSRPSSRRSTPARRSPGKPNQQQQQRSPQIGGASLSSGSSSPFPTTPLDGGNVLDVSKQNASSSVVDCETKVHMYRTVFDVLWALTSASKSGEIAPLQVVEATAAEQIASQIPVPIGGVGAANAVRNLGGVASVEEYGGDAKNQQQQQQQQQPLLTQITIDNTAAATTGVGMTMHGSSSSTDGGGGGPPGLGSRASTHEFCSPAPTSDTKQFPSLTTSNNANDDDGGTAMRQANSTASSWLQQQDDDKDTDFDEEESDDDDDDDDADEQQRQRREDDIRLLAQRLASENSKRRGGGSNANNNDDDDDDDDSDDEQNNNNVIVDDDADLSAGIMATTRGELVCPGNALSNLPHVSMAPWTIIMCQGGYFAAAVFVQGVPIVHKAFHRYVVRRKQGGKQSNQEGIAGSAGSQIRKAQEKKFGEDVQVLLDAWRSLIDASWFVFYAAPSPSNRKLLTAFNGNIVRAAVQEKREMHEHVAAAALKSNVQPIRGAPSDANMSPV